MLSIQNNKIARKPVTVTITPRAYSYLALYTLAKGSFRSRIICELIDNWISKQRIKETDSQLVRQVTVRINSQWKTSHILNPELPFSEFVEIIKGDLLLKGVAERDVESILNGVKEKC